MNRPVTAIPASTVAAPGAGRSDTWTPFGDDLAGPGVVADDLQRLVAAATRYSIFSPRNGCETTVPASGPAAASRSIAIASGRSNKRDGVAHREAARAAVGRAAPLPSASTAIASRSTATTRAGTRLTRPTNCATNCDAGRW